MRNFTLIGYSKNGIYVGSAGADTLEKAAETATAWLKGATIATVCIHKAGVEAPVAVMGLQR